MNKTIYIPKLYRTRRIDWDLLKIIKIYESFNPSFCSFLYFHIHHPNDNIIKLYAEIKDKDLGITLYRLDGARFKYRE